MPFDHSFYGKTKAGQKPLKPSREIGETACPPASPCDREAIEDFEQWSESVFINIISDSEIIGESASVNDSQGDDLLDDTSLPESNGAGTEENHLDQSSEVSGTSDNETPG